MKRLTTWLVAAAVAAILAIVLVPLFRPDSLRSPGPSGLAGSAAPVYDLRDDRGNVVSLDRYRGKIVVLNLWASWCPPCRAEMPDLQRLAGAYAARGVVVIGVNQGESATRARTYAQALGIGFPIWIDEGQRYGRVFAALGLPTTVIVSRTGTIVRGFDGALSLDQMRAALAPLLAS